MGDPNKGKKIMYRFINEGLYIYIYRGRERERKSFLIFLVVVTKTFKKVYYDKNIIL